MRGLSKNSYILNIGNQAHSFKADWKKRPNNGNRFFSVTMEKISHTLAVGCCVQQGADKKDKKGENGKKEYALLLSRCQNYNINMIPVQVYCYRC